MTTSNVFSFRVVGDALQTIDDTIQEKINIRKFEFVSTEQRSSGSFMLGRECFMKFDNYLASFKRELYAMNITEKETNSFVSLCKSLMKNSEVLCKQLIDTRNPKDAISEAFEYIHGRLCEHDSSYKRKEDIEKNTNYVKPIEKVIGLKWKDTSNPKQIIRDFKLVQTRFQFVPISETLSSLFKDQNFRKMYMEYNSEKKHECSPGIYQDFCCGSVFRKHKIFESPLTIQIQIGIDDFDPSDALKSKAGNQKMCGVYFEIRNVPPTFSSKLDMRYLIAIAKVQDIKEEEESTDLIIKHIVKDLKNIEDKGIMVNGCTNLKGALINVSFDNLGGNQVLGFVESFSATYFCRICKCSKTECQMLTTENHDEHRDIKDYLECVQKYLSEDKPVDVKLTKGVKRYCLLNDLKYFQMFDNLSVDIMHDLHEGAIPKFLEIFFTELMRKGYLKEPDIQSMVRDFNYGSLFKEYRPSLLRILRPHNLGQSAQQLYILMIHLPFIFKDHKNDIPQLWNAMKELLSVIRIVHSTCITENDLTQLNQSISNHHKFFVESGINLIPKHHLMTHYPTVIRKMGPIKKMWMMRFECKHTVFTNMASRTCNFINLPKTLAQKHQMKFAAMSRDFEEELKPSVTMYTIAKANDREEHREKMRSPPVDIYYKKAYKFFKINSNEYRRGLMMVHDENLYEIIHIFELNLEYMAFCHPYDIVKFKGDLNSIEIREGQYDGCRIIKLNTALSKPFDRKFHNGKYYIICESLDVFGTACRLSN